MTRVSTPTMNSVRRKPVPSAGPTPGVPTGTPPGSRHRILVMAQGKVRHEYKVEVPRPRDYDDPEVFEVNRRVVKAFLEAAGETH